MTLASNCGAATLKTSIFVKPKKVLRWMEQSVHQERWEKFVFCSVMFILELSEEKICNPERVSYVRTFWHFFLFNLCLNFSGASRAIASGDPASSHRATMGVGAPGQSSVLAPERAEAEFAPVRDSATTLRECCGNEHTFSGQMFHMIGVFIQQMMTCCKSVNAEFWSSTGSD